MKDNPQHLVHWRRLARPNFKLPRALLHKHLDTRDNGDAFQASHPQQRCFQRVVDQVENDLAIQILDPEKR